ncbi:polyunsaturated fatty acid lipoxygenase ALOX15B-like isoform X2 [Varanus komodoensis]|nr:polyunsaturated fatty acid lipoxygenase ALOX15B-like isoform X2 [Varanus komodoensis]
MQAVGGGGMKRSALQPKELGWVYNGAGEVFPSTVIANKKTFPSVHPGARNHPLFLLERATEMKLKAFWGLQVLCKGLDRVFCLGKDPATAYNGLHWKKGLFLGSWSQNQVNPTRTRRFCKLGGGFPGLQNRPSCLQDELQPPKKSHAKSSCRSQTGSGAEAGPAASYKVQVATGKSWGSGTFDAISISLVGTRGESPKQLLNKMGRDFTPGAVDEYEVSSDQELGQVLLVRLHKEPYRFFPDDSWYCSFVRLTTPRGETLHFPCYQWIEGYQTLELREGAGKLLCEDADHPLLLHHRREQVKARQDCYRWAEFAPGMPRCLAVENLEEMDTNIKFSFVKLSSFLLRSKLTVLEVKLKGLMRCQESWKNLEDIRRVFWFNRTPVSEYVANHWQEDVFFGYQYLNGVNPVVIEKCSKIPSNFPVTHEMVSGSLGKSTTLPEEVEKGSIFIVDYKILQDIPTNTIDGQPQYMAAPLCLLYQTPSGDLVPIAIQLSQIPGPESPIFLPSDPMWDWTLAKMWVRNADFHVHQNISHLLRTHLMAEVFTMATLRHLPMCHPLFKLLIPHLRYTLQINALARVRLIREGGMMDLATSAGFEGIVPLVGKGTQNLTYSSLCLPDDIEARGVGSVANYYYRDDAMKIWAAIQSFVTSIIKFYYRSDDRVREDPELQAWIQEIFVEAFQSRKMSGAPSSLQTMEDLIKFLTMVIFTCSAQHAAVNSGQFDYGAWIPNIPPTMRRPPPTVKGTATLENILETIPQVNITCLALCSLWLLSNEVGDTRPLGSFPDEHFTEEEPRRLIEAFQNHLAEISRRIDERNKTLPLPYTYISPPQVENSVSI